MKTVEQTIARLEGEKQELDAKLAEPHEADELQRLCDELAEIADQLDTAEAKWLELQTELDGAE